MIANDQKSSLETYGDKLITIEQILAHFLNVCVSNTETP